MIKTKLPIRRTLLMLALLFSGPGCGAPEPDATGVGKTEQPAIRNPHPGHVEDEVGQGQTAGDPSTAFDDRRDVWEDEFRVIGEDPSRWNQSRPEHILHHGPRPVRKYGFQWLRSYARNATVALFDRSSIVEQPDGTVKLLERRELQDRNSQILMEKVAMGWDLCPEKRFADQYRGGVMANAFCAGTLIDKNLVLTANHCLRDQFDNDVIQPVEDLRLVFNFVEASRGEPPQVLSGRDVYRAREVLSMHVNFVDFVILELLDANGNPTEANEIYEPVPLWESDLAPTPGLYRSGGLIGTGAQLRQKISLSRSWGWQPDFLYLGLFFQGMDSYEGNSGGGLYDVETGTLVGVAHAQSDPTLSVTCPTNPGPGTWPPCRHLTNPGGTPSELEAEALITMPEFDGLAAGTPQWRGCNEWTSHDLNHEQARATEELLKTRFGAVNAIVRPPIRPEGMAPSIHAIRRLACDPAFSQEPFDVALDAEANQMIAERNAFAASPTCFGANDRRCPSIHLVPQARPAAILHHSDLANPRTILRNSRLCTRTLPPPRADDWRDVEPITLEDGREMTFHGTTIGAPDYFSTALDNGLSVPDAVFRLEVGEWTILYADTFSGGHELGPINPGTNLDTTLTLLESEPIGDNVTLDPSNWSVPNGTLDDSDCQTGATDVNFRRQTQLVDELQPGKKYLLMVSGFNGDVGDFNLHIQSIPNPRQGALLRPSDAVLELDEEGIRYKVFAQKPLFPPGASEQNCSSQNGPLEPLCVYNTINPRLQCQGRDSGDFAVIAISCPEFATPQFSFGVRGESAPGGSTYVDDPVAAYWEGHARHGPDGYVCSDDTSTTVEFFPGFAHVFPLFSSEIGHFEKVGPNSAETYLSSGAAVRGFYAHQYIENLDWTKLDYVLKIPEGAVR